jgi:hypothetical protein
MSDDGVTFFRHGVVLAETLDLQVAEQVLRSFERRVKAETTAVGRPLVSAETRLILREEIGKLCAELCALGQVTLNEVVESIQ